MSKGISQNLQVLTDHSYALVAPLLTDQKEEPDLKEQYFFI
jgi:hypothetical protein